MPRTPNQYLIIVCEGLSEYAYIQELNRTLRELGVRAVLHPVCIGSGFYAKAVAKFRQVKKDNPRDAIHIWVDYDIYARNERNCRDEYERRPQGIPAFLFSRQNSEDFLATHLDATRLRTWVNHCRQTRHLETPLPTSRHIPLFRDVLFQNYEKGNLPFAFSTTTLRQMLENQAKGDMPFHCDFAELIRHLLAG